MNGWFAFPQATLLEFRMFLCKEGKIKIKVQIARLIGVSIAGFSKINDDLSASSPPRGL